MSCHSDGPSILHVVSPLLPNNWELLIFAISSPLDALSALHGRICPGRAPERGDRHSSSSKHFPGARRLSVYFLAFCPYKLTTLVCNERTGNIWVFAWTEALFEDFSDNKDRLGVFESQNVFFAIAKILNAFVIVSTARVRAFVSSACTNKQWNSGLAFPQITLNSFDFSMPHEQDVCKSSSFMLFFVALLL